MRIKPYKALPVSFEKISNKTYQITLNEGKKREIRRIFQAIGNKVIKLRRISIGKIILEELNLKAGQYVSVEKEFIIKKIK